MSTGIAGGYCTRLLSDAGATITKVESESGDALRRWSATGATIGRDENGALFDFLAASKRSLTVEPDSPLDRDRVRDLLAMADAVIWTPDSIALREDDGPQWILREHPHLVVVSLTPFGLKGPWAGRAVTEFTSQAWSGGIVGFGRGSPSRPPRYTPGRVGEWLMGAYGCFALLAVWHYALESGVGELIDVSMLATQAMSLVGYDVLWNDMAGSPRLKSGRSLNFPGIHRTKDGLVGLMCTSGQQWLDFCAMVEHPEWAEDKSLFTVLTRANRAEDIIPLVDQWMADRTTDEVRELATLFSIPNAPIVNGATAPQVDHFIATEAFAKNAGGRFIEPTVPYRISGMPNEPRKKAPSLGEANRKLENIAPRVRTRTPSSCTERPAYPLHGIRVLDLTSVWAGPMATKLLASLGAEVIHLESITRPDHFRMQSAREIGDEDWWEWSPNFAGANANKLGLTLDLQTPRGHELALQLAAQCDVVVENFRPRVMENLGLGYDELRAVRSDLIMVRMPGYGLDGPWRNVAAYAQTVEDACGLTWLTGYKEALPEEPFAVADTNAGVHAVIALLLALERRRNTGEGALVEAPMIKAALCLAAEPVIEYSAYGSLLERSGNRGPSAAPQNLYRSCDVDESGIADTWIAIAVESDEQWLALVTAIGSPKWAEDRRFQSSADRRANHDLLDRYLSEWCSVRNAEGILKTLWSSGVPAAKVSQPHELADLEQLKAYEFYEELSHPVYGDGHYETLPIRFSAGPSVFIRRPPPTLGQDNHLILTNLGLTEEAIEVLEVDGVIGTKPRDASHE